MDKKVSIVMCTYNGERYIREQLDSILAQTYPLYEIIIQDDGSTDGTWAIIEEYTTRYPKLIRGIRNEHNLGWNQNFYAAIMNATGDYIACCDQDDIWECDKIERQMEEIGDNWLHACSSCIWDKNNKYPFYSDPKNLSDVFLKYTYCGHQMLFSREMLPYIKLGIEADISHDRLLSFVAIYKQKMVTSHYIGVYWRRHSTTATSQQRSKCFGVSGKSKVLYSIKAFLRNKKSQVITRGINKYDILISYLDSTDGSYPFSKIYLKLFKLLKQQTIWSYILAASCLSKLREDLFGEKRLSVSLLYTIYTYPFRWWYIHREDF